MKIKIIERLIPDVWQYIIKYHLAARFFNHPPPDGNSLSHQAIIFLEFFSPSEVSPLIRCMGFQFLAFELLMHLFLK